MKVLVRRHQRHFRCCICRSSHYGTAPPRQVIGVTYAFILSRPSRSKWRFLGTEGSPLKHRAPQLRGTHRVPGTHFRNSRLGHETAALLPRKDLSDSLKALLGLSDSLAGWLADQSLCSRPADRMSSRSLPRPLACSASQNRDLTILAQNPARLGLGLWQSYK